MDERSYLGKDRVDNAVNRTTDAEASKLKQADMCAAREQNIAEYLDKKIWEYESKIRAIRQFRETISISMLSSPASYLTAIFKD